MSHDPTPDFVPAPAPAPLQPGKQSMGLMPDQEPGQPQPHHVPDDPVAPEQQPPANLNWGGNPYPGKESV